jgi:hypothetical protein
MNENYQQARSVQPQNGIFMSRIHVKTRAGLAARFREDFHKPSLVGWNPPHWMPFRFATHLDRKWAPIIAGGNQPAAWLSATGLSLHR